LPASFIAVDLGAESGRVMLGSLDTGKLELSEAHRFANVPVQVGNSLYWDILRLYGDVTNGLTRVGQEQGKAVASIGIDGWGVDFGLLGADGELLGNPRHYRDHRTDGMLEAAFARAPREEIFAATGIQFMQINTLYQLLAMARGRSASLAAARTFLMVPDLLNYWLTGRAVAEFTNATTTQMLDYRGGWATTLLDRLGIPTHILPSIALPGTLLGDLRVSVVAETGLRGVPVVAPATHDTGSAVAAIPLTGHNAAYVSSGTWSIVGVEVEQPIITAASLQQNFTNEGGVNGTFRYSKNVMGLWLLQECRRAWARSGASSTYEELLASAEDAPPFVALVDPDAPGLLNPSNMPVALARRCAETGQPLPPGPPALTRCILESLALKYRHVLEAIAAVRGTAATVVHVVGGGSRNRLLCQMAANATGCRVVAGPVEATAAGNVLVQAISTGHLASLADGRRLIRDSFNLETYEPADSAAWEQAYQRFKALLALGAARPGR